MKKIILSLIAVACTMSINAQTVKIVKDNQVVATYSSSEVDQVIFEEEATSTTTGEAAVSESAQIPGNKVAWVQLWADGPKWATFNVGAKSVTEDGGFYFWGQTQDHPSMADFDNRDTDEDIQGTEWDTAKNLWGNNWVMPTRDNYEDLIANCEFEWTTNYNDSGKAGLICKGKGDYANNSIFFPAAGDWEDGEQLDANKCCYVWTSSCGRSDESCYFTADKNGGVDVDSDMRCWGLSVRAICK